MSEIKSSRLTKKGIETKRRILTTAEQVFGEKGYYETSVAEITLRTGVAQGTFYNYFPTKKAVFDELIYQLSSDLRFAIKEAMEEQEGFEEKQRAGYHAFFKWVLDHRNLYSVVQQLVLVDPSLYRWYYEKLADGFIKSIETAIDGGDCKPLLPETIAYSMMGIGQFIGMRWVLWENELVPDDVFDEVMEVIFHGINGRG
ncbi:TetR/AcrR family transcriptional regulator [Oceanobacillus luteolus]|uniref:TetR/AcrR family transcriptional regulator n=1 Tax=Oceanobacillus luteolus TaxID=1274358 RepID=A0ABW4HLD4_9BACI|nr:TetR/AcrR family transcriptional regulator [Oceanobacillus luteolus]MCM3740665.1 TetR/AcrR family transcriptional regulator [Oceanobacillus luteolus]